MFTFRKPNAILDSIADSSAANKTFSIMFWGIVLVMVAILFLHWPTTLQDAHQSGIVFPEITVFVSLLAVCVFATLMLSERYRSIGQVSFMVVVFVAVVTLVPFWKAAPGMDQLLWPHVFQAGAMILFLTGMLFTDWRVRIVCRILLFCTIEWIVVPNLTTGLDAAVQYAAYMGVPAPQLMVPFAQGMLGVSGFMILLGIHPRAALGLYMLFLIGVSPLMHPFWTTPTEGVYFAMNMLLLCLAGMSMKDTRSWRYVLWAGSSVEPAFAR